MLIQNREITHPDVTTLVRRSRGGVADRGIRTQQPVAAASRRPVRRRVCAGQACRLRRASSTCGDDAAGAVAEIKRMCVRPAHRRTGVARRILAALERRIDAAGLRPRSSSRPAELQPEAIALLRAPPGYLPIPAVRRSIVDNPTTPLLFQEGLAS